MGTRVDIQFKSDVDVELIQSMGGDHMVVAAAKVSTCGSDALSFSNGTALNDKGEPWSDKDSFGLINYLMKHRHGTPFEHSAMTFFVRAPIFVWREWHRHRVGFSYNEESARYSRLAPVFYLPAKSRPMFKVDGWKPGRPKFLRYNEVDGGLGSKVDAEAKYLRFIDRKVAQYRSSYESYEQSLADGFDPGLARIDLPVGIYSGCWVTCNPRSLMSFLSLRTHEPEAKQVSYPLWEIELAARACERMFATGWPLTYKTFCDNGRVGP